MNSPIRFLHISDTHFGPTKDFIFHHKNPYKDAQNLVNEINNLSVTPDFIIHTGDLISFQDHDAYERAQEVLQDIKIPMYFTTGNHDDPELLNNFPLFAKKKNLTERKDSVSYYFEFGNYLLITIDAKNPDDQNPSGVVASDVLEKLNQLLSKTDKSFILFTHFPALSLDAPWIDKHLLISNGLTLHEMLKNFQSRCLGVFFGHIHQPLQTYADGILYISAPSTTFQFGGWASDIDIISYHEKTLPGMNLVSVIGNQVIIKYLQLPIFKVPGY